MPTLDTILGAVDTSNVSSFAINTTAPAAAGSKIIVMVSYFEGGAHVISGVNDGSAYTNAGITDSGNDHCTLWWRDAAAGLSSGTNITFTCTGALDGGIYAQAVSFLNCNAGGPEATGTNTSTAADWDTTLMFPFSSDFVTVGACGMENATAATNTGISLGFVETRDTYDAFNDQGHAQAYELVIGSGAAQLQGQWSNGFSTNNTVFAACFGGTAGADPTIAAFIGRLPQVGRSVTGFAPGMKGPGSDRWGQIK